MDTVDLIIKSVNIFHHELKADKNGRYRSQIFYTRCKIRKNYDRSFQYTFIAETGRLLWKKQGKNLKVYDLPYPQMKLLDMGFWQIGFDNDEKKGLRIAH